MAVVVSGAVKDYPWGMVDGMVPWTGRGTGRPQAELWFGTHPAGPSPTLDGSTADLALGRAAPLLVKILAAAHPLSIQIHPDEGQAAKGFAEMALGDDLYSDPLAKHEMLVALTECTGLAGWRSPEDAAAVLAALGYSEAVVALAREGRFADAARGILSGLPSPGPWDPSHVRQAIPADDQRKSAALGDIAAAYPEDPGVGLAAILRFFRLQAGEAIYVPAGVPHAYLRGVGLEVMTSSDNVLRMGLTSKRVAVEHALAAIREDAAPVLLRSPGLKAPSGAPFRVLLQRGVNTLMERGNYRVVVAIDGPVTVTQRGAPIALAIGQAILVPATDPPLTVSSEAMVALVESVG